MILRITRPLTFRHDILRIYGIRTSSKMQVYYAYLLQYRYRDIGYVYIRQYLNDSIIVRVNFWTHLTSLYRPTARLSFSPSLFVYRHLELKKSQLRIIFFTFYEAEVTRSNAWLLPKRCSVTMNIDVLPQYYLRT